MPGEQQTQRDGEAIRSSAAEDAVAGASAANALRVLLVEDSDRDAELIEGALRRGGYGPLCERVATAEDMKSALERGGHEVVVAEYRLAELGASTALALLRESGRDLPFLIVSEPIGVEAAVEAMRSGAHDCIDKGNLARLALAIERELGEAQERRRGQVAEAARRDEAALAVALARVSRQLIVAFDNANLLERLCQVTAEVLRCDVSHTLIYDESDDCFVPIANYGATPEEREIARVVRVPRGLMRVLLERLASADAAEVHTVPRAALSSIAPPRESQVCAALRRDGSIVGVQVASRRERTEPFTELERRIAGGIGQLASLALEHARVLEELERASRIKSEFVATVSHELRTPLNVVMGYSELLFEGAFGPLNAEQLDTVRHIGNRARGLLELISATLDLSRIEAGRVAVELEEVDVGELLGSLEAEIADLHRKSAVETRWDVAADLPPMYTDAAKLKVVLKNLIGNAIKFTDRGTVSIRARHAGGTFEFDVCDTGIGIPRESLSIIFEPFRQVDGSSTRRYGGVGLGLYIVRRLLDLLGGSVSVESEVGKGAAFHVAVSQRLELPIPPSR